jgi:serine/threonine protein kinase/CheY-like chemotaxis protein
LARILLAEDYDDLRDMICELLQAQEHHVDAHGNGQSAYEASENAGFDLMILDWDLPRVDGIEICKRHRAQGGNTPILMLTGKKSVSDKEEAFDLGADDYLTKPFHPKELLSRIKALLRRSSATSGGGSPIIGEFKPGMTFVDRYEIIMTLGRGSTGIIYKAKHLFLNRFVALKVLHPQLIGDAENVARFKREAQAISALDHPNIIGIHDFGITPEGLPYIVMDFSGGETLMNRIQSRDHLTAEEALPIFIQACEALSHAHSRGVIHRDVKPGNMLIVQNEDGRESLKLVDFGIAKFAHAGKAMQVTQNGDVLGSPLYMSPEQCMGSPLDGRSDIFSLGCVMYTSFMGREPFMGENILDTMYRRTVDDPIPFQVARPDVRLPQILLLETIIFRALQRNLDERYQTMDELKEDLQRVACALA